MYLMEVLPRVVAIPPWPREGLLTRLLEFPEAVSRALYAVHSLLRWGTTADFSRALAEGDWLGQAFRSTAEGGTRHLQDATLRHKRRLKARERKRRKQALMGLWNTCACGNLFLPTGHTTCVACLLN